MGRLGVSARKRDYFYWRGGLYQTRNSAPTPTRLGPSLLPSALSPWQVAQFLRNSARPSSSVCVEMPAAAWASLVGASAEYAPPVAARAVRSSTTGANRWRRRRETAPRTRRSTGGVVGRVTCSLT